MAGCNHAIFALFTFIALAVVCNPVPEFPKDWISPVQQQRLRRPVVLNSVTCSFLPFAENFWIHHHGWLEDHVLFIAEDPLAYQRLLQLVGSSLVVARPGGGVSAAAATGPDWNTTAYKEILQLRASYVRYFLRLGMPTILLDNDVVFKQNPLRVIPFRWWDVVALRDTADGAVNPYHAPYFVCGCLLAFSTSPQSMALVEDWEQKLLTTPGGDDQALINIALAEALAGPNGPNSPVLRMFILPTYLFPCGADWGRFNVSAVWYHTNYMIGKQAKMDALKAAGMWRATTEFPTCQNLTHQV